MASNSGRSSQFWIDKLLQLNSGTNMTYNEVLSVSADLETYINVSKEELKQLKGDVEFKKAEHKHKIELRNTLRQFYEELKCSEKRVDELIKVKNYNCELAKEIYDLRTEKALERDKQRKELEKQLTDAYKESIEIFESQPLVIKRNQMRNQLAKRKFEISFLKQKISDLSKVYLNLQNMEKLIQQRKIIKFADNMLKYYKKQKEVNEALKNKKTNKIQEQTNNLQVIVETPQQSNTAELPKKLEFLNLTNYNFIYKKPVSQNETGLKNYMMQTTQSVEIPKLNMNPLQFTPLNLSNYEFNATNYLKSSTSINSKPEHQAPAKSIFQNILNTPKPNWNPLTLPKLDYNLETYTPKLQSQEKVTSKNKQKLKRPSDTQQSLANLKISATVKNIQKIKHTSNSSKENEKRIFFSQTVNKNTQNEDEFVFLSQDSQQSTTTENRAQKIKSLKQIFNLQANDPKKTETIEVHKQIPAENIKQGSLNQMFNFQATVPKTTETNDASKQNLSNKQRMNQIFDQKNNIPKSNEVHEVQKQIPVENNIKTVNFSNHAQPIETKSPYFANQTVTSSQGEQSLNTSAGHTEQTINVSSDQPPSQISASEEYYDTSVHEHMETDQMMTAEGSYMIDHNNAECNMEQYYEENPDMQAQGMEEIQYMSPVLSPTNFLSPSNENILEENEQNNVSAATNIFGAAQNVGNSFFNFGQSQSKSGGSFFNMF